MFPRYLWKPGGTEKGRKRKSRGGGGERWRLRGCGPMTLTHFLFLFFFFFLPLSLCHLYMVNLSPVLYSLFLFRVYLICVTTYPHAIDDVVYFSSRGHTLISNRPDRSLNEIECVQNTEPEFMARLIRRGTVFDQLCDLLSHIATCLN